MWKVISWLKDNLVFSVPSFMIAGIIFGALVDPSFLKSLIIPLTFLMVYPMMINLQIAKVFSGGDFQLQLVTQLINFAIVPFFAFGVGKIFFNDQPLILLGLLLTSLLPTSGMTISWTGFAKVTKQILLKTVGESKYNKQLKQLL